MAEATEARAAMAAMYCILSFVVLGFGIWDIGLVVVRVVD